MINNKKITAMLLLSALALTGCGVKATKPIDMSVSKYSIDETREDEIHEAIVNASKSAAKSLNILASVNNAEKNDVLTYEQIRQARFNATYIPVGFESKITITNWDGPISPILRRLEVLSGYKFVVLTPEPSYGLFVTLNFKDATLMDVVNSIDAQLGSVINIEIIEDEKVVKVRYGY